MGLSPSHLVPPHLTGVPHPSLGWHFGSLGLSLSHLVPPHLTGVPHPGVGWPFGFVTIPIWCHHIWQGFPIPVLGGPLGLSPSPHVLSISMDLLTAVGCAVAVLLVTTAVALLGAAHHLGLLYQLFHKVGRNEPKTPFLFSPPQLIHPLFSNPSPSPPCRWNPKAPVTVVSWWPTC